MTIVEHSSDPPVPGHPAPQPWRPGSSGPRTDPAPLLPDPSPVRLLGAADTAREGAERMPDRALLHELYHRLVVGRRFNQQATILAKQGRLAVYPASTGQEACQIAAGTVLRAEDWLFPSYRDTLAVVSRGIAPQAALALLRGDAHSGYDPLRWCTAPLSTPLATQAPHAVGLAHAARLRGEETVALALVGDGGTSEGDFHEALNFAAVLRAPVVFLVQNNGYAISVPLARQSAAPSLAHKAVGYGMPGRLVDGNDAAAVHTVLSEAVEHARAGAGPVLVEAVTYRLDPHTNADADERYRARQEVAAWREHDPVLLLEQHLTGAGLLDEATRRAAADAADQLADSMREGFRHEPRPDPMSLFAHVYAEPTPQLVEQAARLAAELAAEEALRTVPQ